MGTGSAMPAARIATQTTSMANASPSKWGKGQRSLLCFYEPLVCAQRLLAYLVPRATSGAPAPPVPTCAFVACGLFCCGILAQSDIFLMQGLQWDSQGLLRHRRLQGLQWESKGCCGIRGCRGCSIRGYRGCRGFHRGCCRCKCCRCICCRCIHRG